LQRLSEEGLYIERANSEIPHLKKRPTAPENAYPESVMKEISEGIGAQQFFLLKTPLLGHPAFRGQSSCFFSFQTNVFGC
jgi:hypothetical protein